MGDIEDPRSRARHGARRLSSLLGQEALGRVLEKLGRVLDRMLAKQHESPRARGVGSGSPELRRLKRGELSVEEYIEAKVDLAVAPLKGVLHADDLGYVRALVRDKLETDPRLRHLLGRVLGDPEPAPSEPRR
jgi:hypothetical protein